MSRVEPNQPSDVPRFPPPDQPILAELANQPRFRFRAAIVVIAIIIGLIVARLVFVALPGELSRWKIASAEEKRLNGDLQGAIQDLDRAIVDNPQEVQLLSKRAQWHKERGDYQAALEDCNRVVELRPDDGRSYAQRSEVFQYLGRGAEAVADWKRIMTMESAQTREGRTLSLNGLAYYRALANIEIDEALVDIDEALRLGGEEYQMLDTRGFLYYRHHDLDRALKDLDRAVANADEDYEAWRSRSVDKGFGLPDRREQELDAREKGRVLAVILYHRGLVYQERGDKELAEQDFQRVKNLGFEPREQLF